MATAKKLPSGSYRIRVHIGNGKYRSFTAPTKKEAEYIAARYLQENKANTPDMTVGEAIDRYISSKENVLSPATVREYKRSRTKDLQDIINIKLSALTQEMIQSCINKEAITHSPKTIRNMHGLLSAALGMFRTDFKLSTTLPQNEKTEISVPIDEDIQKMIACAKGKKIENPILLSAFGSLRRSEISALEWDDIQGNFIIVNKAMVKNDKSEWVIKKPKTYAGYRKVEMPASVIEIIKSKEKICEYNPHQITKTFARFLEQNNLKHIRFHDLRHYQASILMALGVPDKYIMKRGGWASRHTLNKIYQHTMSDKESAFADIANKHFTNLINDDKKDI